MRYIRLIKNHASCVVGRSFGIALLLMAALPAGALTPEEAFADAPRRIFPLLDRNMRLDMVDYYRSSLSTPTPNALKGTSAVTQLTPSSIRVRLSGSSQSELALLPAKGDTLLAVINTVSTPAPDSKLSVYDRAWRTDLTSRVFTRPQLADWLTAEGRKNADEVATYVPFLLISYDYDPATATLTLTNNTGSFLSEDVYAIVQSYFKPSLTYRWNGSKFVSLR